MDDKDLLHQLRMQFVCVTVSRRVAGLKDETIPAEVRRGLGNLQTAATNAIEDNSIEFGRRRAIPSTLFGQVVATSGKHITDMKAMLATLTEQQRVGFGLGLDYEPVPDSAGFGMLPANYQTALGRAVDTRAVNAYYDGFDKTFRCYHSRLSQFLERVSAYHAYCATPGPTRVILREVVVASLVSVRNLLGVVNIAGNSHAAEAVDAVTYLQTVTVDDLRKDAKVRETAFSEVQMAFAITKGYFADDPTAEEPADGAE